MKDQEHSEWLQIEHSSAPGDIFGEPKKKTRIGDEYQAEIPTFMTEDERSQYEKTVFPTYQNQANKQESANGESGRVIEYHTFLLGLYMFGKNLGLVNKFLGNVGTHYVLSYYYGMFYGTKEHKLWSKCRKNRSRKYVPGKKIFAGWRQQKLFSRLFPHVTDKSKRTLTEASYMFKDGNLPFEKYVFEIRDTVGANLFLEALAIGEGKGDLTSTTEMPRERKKKLQPPCSSLNTEETINLLKDRIGLSTERLRELFWEAVWPRLLNRGWHSEFPSTTNFTSQKSKDLLVFLSPGIKKFSRRSLTKGIDYFESFTDVLNKVASEPALLEPEPHHDQSVNPHGIDEERDSVEFVVVEASTVSMERVLTMSEIRISSLSKPTNTSTPEESENDDTINDISLKCNEQLDFLSPMDAAGASTDQPPGPNGQKLISTIKRSMTEEAFESGTTSRSKNPKKRKQCTDDNCTDRRHDGTKTPVVASYAENGVAGVV